MANDTATPGEIWQLIKSVVKAQKENERTHELAQKETKRLQQETKQAQQKTERTLQRLGKEHKKTEKALRRAMGYFNNSWGEFLENLAEADISNILQSKGISVTKTSNMRVYKTDEEGKRTQELAAEYDLVAVDGEEIVVFEVKRTLDSDKLSYFLGKLKKFRKYFNEYADKKIYGGVTYMKAEEKALQDAQKEGLFVIKTPGGAKGVSTLMNPDGFRPREF